MVSGLFICGCGHTGTSLVANMFASNPAVFIPLDETGAFLSDGKPEVLAQRFRASERAFLVEKTPRHLRVIPSIRAAMPGSRFLLMVRDGRDVAASFIKRFGDADRGIARWINDCELVLKHRDDSDCLVLRYEDLIAAPDRALQSACEFGGIPFSENMLSYHQTERRWFGVGSAEKGSGADGVEHNLLRNWQINQPLFDGRGQWQGKLTPEQLASLEAGRGGKLMAAFGYLTT